jgi:hypothetical protein
MNQEKITHRTAARSAAVVFLLGGIPSFFLETPWQGWLLSLGLAVIAFLVVSVMTSRSRV